MNTTTNARAYVAIFIGVLMSLAYIPLRGIPNVVAATGEDSMELDRVARVPANQASVVVRLYADGGPSDDRSRASVGAFRTRTSTAMRHGGGGINTSSGLTLGAMVGRFIALVLNGLAVVWVLAVAVSIVADRPRTITLVIIAAQAIAALGIQTWVLWRIATGWVVLSNARRVGITLLGVIVAPIVVALGIVGAAAAALVWVVLAVLGGAGRAASAPSRTSRSSAGEPAGSGWTLPESPRKKCTMCDGGKLPCYPCGSTGYVYADGVAVGTCHVCSGAGASSAGTATAAGSRTELPVSANRQFVARPSDDASRPTGPSADRT